MGDAGFDDTGETTLGEVGAVDAGSSTRAGGGARGGMGRPESWRRRRRWAESGDALPAAVAVLSGPLSKLLLSQPQHAAAAPGASAALPLSLLQPALPSRGSS
ncbi:MAG: hypothetical protein ACK4ZJ_16360, partial [Allorhizobium sp.]